MGLFGKKKDKESKDKKKFNETGFGRFVTKAVKKLPDIAEDVMKIAANPWTGSVEVLGELFEDKKKEAEEVGDHNRLAEITELQLQFEQNRQNFEKEVFALEVQDRESARDMFKSDSWLQKTFALTFLVCYMGLTVYIVYILIQSNTKATEPLPDYVIALISTVFGSMSAKLTTIVSFLFGSSMGSKQKNELISKSS